MVTISRTLSTYENFFRCRSEFGYYGTFQVVGNYSQPISDGIMSQVLKTMMIDYNMLTCNVFPHATEAGQFIMRPVALINYHDVVFDLDDKYLTNGIINELGMKFLNCHRFKLGVEAPLFKIFYNQQYSVLSAVFDHAINDGLIGNYFHEEFIKHLQTITHDEFSPILFDFIHHHHLIINSLPPPIDEFIPLDIDFYQDFNFDGFNHEQFPRFPGRFLNSPQSDSIAFKLVNFPPDELAKILTRLKAQNVTLTSYLQIIFNLSFQPVFKDTYTVTKVAIALRKYIPWDNPDYKIWGNSPHTGLGQNLPPISSFSWPLVDQFNKNLKNIVNNRNILNLMQSWFNHYLTEDEKNRQYFDALIGKEKVEATKLSNLGFIKLPPVNASGFELVNLIFSQDISPITSDFMINVISTEKGGLNIVISYFDHRFDDFGSDFDELVATFRDNCIKYAA